MITKSTPQEGNKTIVYVAGPRGAQGIQGPRGATGSQGPAGPSGPIGPQGSSSGQATYSPLLQPAFVGVIQPNPSANFNGATLFSATNLSSNQFTTSTANITTLAVSGSTTIAGSLNVTGTVTMPGLSTTSLNGLTVTSSTGTLTIAALKTLTANNTLTFSGTDGSILNIGTGGTLGTNAYTSTAYFPVAGGAMTGGITNSTSINPLTTLAESWIGPSSTSGIYFKGGNVGVGTTSPSFLLEVVGNIKATSTVTSNSVKYYGAVGNGVTDDSTAFQSAASAGGMIYIPTGTYLINTPINVSSNTTFEGIGDVTIKTTANISIFSSNQSISNITFRNLKFLGKNQNFSLGIEKDNAIFFDDGVTNLVVENNQFTQISRGVYASSVSESRISGNIFSLISGIPINIATGIKVTVQNNKIDGARTGVGDGFGSLVGIWFQEGTGGGYGNLIDSNTIFNVYMEGINIHSAYTRITNNYVKNSLANTGTGIVAEGTGNSYILSTPPAAYYMEISNNIVDHAGIAVRFDPANPGAPPGVTLISGNLVQGGSVNGTTSGYGIKITGENAAYTISKVQISNNRIQDISSCSSGGNCYGIYLTNVSNSLVSNNFIDNIPSSGGSAGIGLVSTDTLGSQGVIIDGNTITNPGTAGIIISGTVSNAVNTYTISNNTIDMANSSHAVYVDPTVSDATSNGIITNNNIYNTSYGLDLTGSNLAIFGNITRSVNNPVHFAGTYTTKQIFAFDNSTYPRLGIGTITPAAYVHVTSPSDGTPTLLVSGNSTTNSSNLFQVEKNHGATPSLTVGSTGLLGIGTATPQYSLDLFFSNSGAGTPSMRMISGGSVFTQMYSDNGVGAAVYSHGIYSGDNSYRVSYGTDLDINPRLIINNSGNVGIGTTDPHAKLSIGGGAARSTTEGTNRLDIFDGTAPVGTLANGISIYSSAGEAYIMDAAGNATLQSPHDLNTNYWVFDSKNAVKNTSLVIDMEQMMKQLNVAMGWDYVHETLNGVTLSTTPIPLNLPDTFFSAITTRITTWLADAGNGIAKIFANEIDSNSSNTKNLCVSDDAGTKTCITKSQLDTLLASPSSQGGVPASSGGGGNPATCSDGIQNQDETGVDTGGVCAPAVAATLESIAITTPATKLSYTVNDTLDITGLAITGTYSDTTTKVETITDSDMTGFNSEVPATGQVLTVTIGEKTTTYAIDVNEASQ